MDTEKRNFLTTVIPAAIALPLGFFSAVRFTNAQMPTRPAGAQNPGPPIHHTNPDTDLKVNSKDILKQNQKQIHDDVEQLYKLATELKDEVEKTDATNTLSLPMVQKAEQIEKLAKQVKNLTRGG